MGRRNWCSIILESEGLLFDIRVEKEKGQGETVEYGIFGFQGFNPTYSHPQVSYTSTSPAMDSRNGVVDSETGRVSLLVVSTSFAV